MVEFWKLTPKKLIRYQGFCSEKLKQENNKINEGAWLHGVYIAHAISSCLSKNAKYPKQPIGDASKEGNQEDVLNDANRFYMWAMVFNKQEFGGIGGEDERQQLID